MGMTTRKAAGVTKKAAKVIKKAVKATGKTTKKSAKGSGRRATKKARAPKATAGTPAKGASAAGETAQVQEQGSRVLTRADLLAGLNEDLAWEFNAVITYRLFASMCSGPHRQELRQFFESEIPDELMHAQLLTDKIVALGGTPTAVPAPVEITTRNRRMLELALRAERATVERYRVRAEQADALGEIALKVRLEDLIAEETHHAEEIERILTNWKR